VNTAASIARGAAAARRWLSAVPRAAFWAPALVLVFWAVAAKGFDAYVRFPWLDVPTHFAGGIAGVCCIDACLVALRPLTGRVHPALRLALAFGLLACAAMGWEFLEYLSDLFCGTHLNLGVGDTLSDLFFGLLGGGWGVGVRGHLGRQAPHNARRLPRRRGTVISGHPRAVQASEGTNAPNPAVNGRANTPA